MNIKKDLGSVSVAREEGIMNREIKFRVYNLEEKCWDNPALLEVWDNSGVLKHLYDYKNKETVVQQFTGLKDKNGREIYEGDIINFKYLEVEHFEYVGKVIFMNGCFIVTNKTTNHPLWNLQIKEIVGNIHENPELLENK